MSDNFKLSDPEYVGEFQIGPPDLQVEDVNEPSKKLGWTCSIRDGWEVKLWTPKLRHAIDDLQKQEAEPDAIMRLIDEHDNLTGELKEFTPVLAMGIRGWVQGLVVTDSATLPGSPYVDSEGSVFPLKEAPDERNCWVTSSQINKKCFEMIK